MASETDLVLERVLDAPRHLVWRAWTDPEHLKRWWAPKPYQTPECEMDLRPGGNFYTRMTGPDGFDDRGSGCFLDVVDGQTIVWTSALGPGWRPNDLSREEGCAAFPFTAIISFEDAGDGKTRYRAVALHANQADRDTHERMGFHEGWGACATQLEQVARDLPESA